MMMMMITIIIIIKRIQAKQNPTFLDEITAIDSKCGLSGFVYAIFSRR